MELFSPEARLVLRLGHKFAIESELKSSLKLLAEATYEAFAAKFNASNRRSTSLPATTTQLTFTRQPSNDGNTTLQWAMSSDTNRESGIDGWKRSILRDIELIEEPKRSKLDLLVLKGIRDLRKLPIVLKQADKNLGLVPIHTHIYEQMVLTHLNDRNTYRIAPADFYAMPKIHKRKLFVTRPIAAQHSYILAPLSKALATELLKVQDTLPTIAKDSKTTAKELDAFTFGMVDTEPLVMMFSFVAFNGKVYHQICGTAMGTPVAPQFANLYFYYKEAIRTLRNSTSKSEWLDALSKIFCGLRESNKDTRPDGILSLTTYHRYTKPIWRKLIDKHNLMNRLSLRSKRFNLRQLKLQELWPPIVVYKDFTKIGHHLIRANTDPQLETGIPS